MKLVMLLALMLPLQGFASLSCGTVDSASLATHTHCIDTSSGHQSNYSQQHHRCGSCCTAAIAITPTHWIPPPRTNSGITLPAHSPPPKITLDRLDRPPRIAL